jgi:hypothetical protein
MATLPAATTLEMMTQVSSSMQMTAVTLCTDCQALNDVVLQSTALRMKGGSDEQVCSSKCVISTTDKLYGYQR